MSALTRPQPRRVVPAAVVDALVAEADREITSLELQVERAVAAADDAEARLGGLGIDERASAWATVQLERFVTELRADAQAESAAMVAEAKLHARMIIEEADADAEDRRTHEAMFGPAPAPDQAAPQQPAPPQAVVPQAAAPQPAAPAPAPPAPPTPPAAPAQHAVASPVPSAPVPPVSDADAMFGAPAPTPPAPDAISPTPDADFWPAESPKRRRFVRTKAKTVVAPTLAGLLVVAAALVRLS
jgi:hypothetical protein